MKISRVELIKAIRETGREPVQRDTFYQPVAVAGNTRLSPAPCECNVAP